jgi:membrane protein DedA with SNARE-associated domain
VAEFWAEWGALAYLGAALWAFFEGETFLLVAAALGATTGVVSAPPLLAAAWLGSFAGDQTWFAVGRRFGPGVSRRFPRLADRLERASSLLRRHETVFVLSFRFLYGVRNVAPVACGVAGMRWGRFAALNFAAAGIWAASFIAAGWFLGAQLGPERLMWGLGGVAVAVVSVLMLRRAMRRRPAST